MNRRALLAAGSATVATSALALDRPRKLSVGVIGHTGRGNYGHKLDTVWLKLVETEIVAVADPDESGLAKACKRLETSNGFTDYHEMLEKEKLDIVAVCPRHADQHHDMALAAIESGARGIYIEKPFVRTPAEVDSLARACNKHGTKIAIAHRNRWHPMLRVIDKFIADGHLGNLLEIRARGKGDRRGGGEDLWVLGSHVLNLIHYFGGTPRTCSARMFQNGQPVTAEHVRDGNEGLGPLAGNSIHARYEMEEGMIAYFDSIANDGTQNLGFGLHLVGSNGIITIHADRQPLAYWVPGNPFGPTLGSRPWTPFTTGGPGAEEPNLAAIHAVQNHITPATDLIEAVKEDRQPLCNLEEGGMTVEMICGVFESHRQMGTAVDIPLKERGNALEKL